MMDVFAEATRSIAVGSMTAPLLVFTVGVLSSVGPCTAPRVLTVLSCIGASPQRAGVIITAFLGGLMTTYASFGALASLLGHLIDFSHWTYGLMAGALLIGGIITLTRAQTCDAERRAHQRHETTTSLGGVFLLGASFALVISPCCTPFVTTIVAYTADVGDPLYGSALLAAFALGHGLPIALAGCGANSALQHFTKHHDHPNGAHRGYPDGTERLHEERRLNGHGVWGNVTPVISGTIMLVLSTFSWCLV